MKSFKKGFKRVCIIMLILMASVGIGLGGAAPTTVFRKKEDTLITIELFESHAALSDIASEEYKP
jgi:hypothetical protein